jgi:CheY-like chemotaxis protein
MVHYRDGLGCGGDFVYMAGAALKPFLRSLNYREMICGGGILISEELVMVESNGDDDYGGMYVEGRQDSSRFIVNDDLNVMLKGFSSEQERGPREESDLLGEYDRVIREFPLFAEFDYEKLFFLKELFEALMARDSGEEILSGDRFEDIFERYFLRFGNEGVSSFEEKLRAAFDLYDFAPLWDSVFDSTKMRVFEMFMRIYKKCRILSEAKRVKREESEDVISDSGTKDFRVLIVDDEEIVSEPLSIYLGEISFTSFSYDIRTMRNTSEAIEWILDNRPQMIFLDNEIRGSGISGERFILEHVLPAIRSLDDYHPCIVLMTGYLTDKLIYLARDYGVRLLHKPFNLLTDIKPIADDTIRNHLAEKKPREAAGRAGTRDAMLAAIGCRAVSSGV